MPLEQYAYNETRYRMLLQSDPERAETLLQAAQMDTHQRWQLYQQLATLADVTARKNGTAT
jgi:pyruvate-ferredoxin/flavodoxin oxidoreductase